VAVLQPVARQVGAVTTLITLDGLRRSTLVLEQLPHLVVVAVVQVQRLQVLLVLSV
jgi:hypothetical protein